MTAASPASHQPPAGLQHIRIGVSSCLLGEEVRFDRGRKRSSFVADQLARYFGLRSVCPEVAIGLGVPREPIRLQGEPQNPRVVGVKTRELDVTEPLQAYGRRMARELGPISGYVFKSKSPSCGLFRVKVYDAKGTSVGQGRGAYARALTEALPLLPVEEEGRLNDPVLRENFIGRVYAYRRWQDLLEAGVTAKRLVDFHTAHKLALMAHQPEKTRALGRFVAALRGRPTGDNVSEYGARFMEILAHRATRKRHTDVLFHVMGYLKRALDSTDRQELVELIHDYRQGLIPLIVPVTLLRHHFRRHPDPYIEQQLYLNWQPAGLSLWNAI